ncbi:acyltransferase family protein [Sulfurospirillum sp. 1612]|uniref:acyltransferase family protein n=1 Tax=Sulfurospirillum sp. 1612 TaxID=3094835 RepID=UPI002F953A8F
MIKQKINWIDNIKALGILAVILGHIASPFGSFIFSWHMPLFFMLAGFFVRFDLSLKELIIKDFKRLMIPYFIFVIVGLIMETLKRIALHREALDYVNEFKAAFIWMDMTSLLHTYAFVLWFLPALFFARVILVILNKYIQNILLQLVFVFTVFISSFYIDLPFGIDNAMNALIFVFIGNIFFRFHQDNKIVYVLPFLLISSYFLFGIPTLDMSTKSYGPIILNIAWAVAMVGTLVIIFKKLNIKSQILTLWGGNTMLLFIIHPYTNNIAHIVVEKLHFGDWYLKLFISLALLQCLLFIKLKFAHRGILKYV